MTYRSRTARDSSMRNQTISELLDHNSPQFRPKRTRGAQYETQVTDRMGSRPRRTSPHVDTLACERCPRRETALLEVGRPVGETGDSQLDAAVKQLLGDLGTK